MSRRVATTGRRAVALFALVLVSVLASPAFAAAVDTPPRPEDYGLDFKGGPPSLAGLPWWLVDPLLIGLIIALVRYFRAMARYSKQSRNR